MRGRLLDRRPSSALVVLLAVLLVFTSARADEAGEALLGRARAAQGSYETLRAHFVQERNVSLVEGTLRSSGTFLLDRAGRVAWIVEEPEPLRVVITSAGVFADGERVDRHAPAGIGPLSVARGFVDFFAASPRALARDFEIRRAGDDRLRLEPRRDALARWLAAVELGFAGERLLPRTIVLEESEGDSTTIRLSDVVLDPELHADAFAP